MALIVLLVIVAWRLVQDLTLLKILILTSGLVLTDDISTLSDQFRLLDAALLYSKHLLKANAFHLSLHRSENKVARTRLQSLVRLLTDQNFVRRAL